MCMQTPGIFSRMRSRAPEEQQGLQQQPLTPGRAKSLHLAAHPSVPSALALLVLTHDGIDFWQVMALLTCRILCMM